MTKASDNPFPSALFEEQTAAPTTPSTGDWRVYFKSDGIYVVDDAGTETGPLAASGFTNPMTTKGDVIVGGTSGTAARLGVGTDGQVLTAASGETDGVKWAAGGSGVANYTQVVLNNTTNLTTTTTSWADIDSTNLTASLTTAAHRVRLRFKARVACSGTAKTLMLNFSVDGTAVKTESAGAAPLLFAITAAVANTSVGIDIEFTTDVLSAASHTFKPRWANVSASTTFTLELTANDYCIFSAEELPY